MHLLAAVLAEADVSFWERMLEKWGFPTLCLLLIGLWGRKQIERLIASHVSLVETLSTKAGETHTFAREARDEAAEAKELARRVLRRLNPKRPDEGDEA